jgi:hypothetical protein
MYDNDICNNITYTRTESDFWCVITKQNSVLYSESGFSKFKSSMLAWWWTYESEKCSYFNEVIQFYVLTFIQMF